MANPEIRFPLASKIICFLAALIIFFPSLFVFIAHHIKPSFPSHVTFTTRILVSVFGLAVMLVGLIPTLILANRSDEK